MNYWSERDKDEADEKDNSTSSADGTPPNRQQDERKFILTAIIVKKKNNTDRKVRWMLREGYTRRQLVLEDACPQFRTKRRNLRTEHMTPIISGDREG